MAHICFNGFQKTTLYLITSGPQRDSQFMTNKPNHAVKLLKALDCETDCEKIARHDVNNNIINVIEQNSGDTTLLIAECDVSSAIFEQRGQRESVGADCCQSVPPVLSADVKFRLSAQILSPGRAGEVQM